MTEEEASSSGRAQVSAATEQAASEHDSSERVQILTFILTRQFEKNEPQKREADAGTQPSVAADLHVASGRGSSCWLAPRTVPGADVA